MNRKKLDEFAVVFLNKFNENKSMGKNTIVKARVPYYNAMKEVSFRQEYVKVLGVYPHHILCEQVEDNGYGRKKRMSVTFADLLIKEGF